MYTNFTMTIKLQLIHTLTVEILPHIEKFVQKWNSEVPTEKKYSFIMDVQ